MKLKSCEKNNPIWTIKLTSLLIEAIENKKPLEIEILSEDEIAIIIEETNIIKFKLSDTAFVDSFIENQPGIATLLGKNFGKLIPIISNAIPSLIPSSKATSQNKRSIERISDNLEIKNQTCLLVPAKRSSSVNTALVEKKVKKSRIEPSNQPSITANTCFLQIREIPQSLKGSDIKSFFLGLVIEKVIMTIESPISYKIFIKFSDKISTELGFQRSGETFPKQKDQKINLELVNPPMDIWIESLGYNIQNYNSILSDIFQDLNKYPLKQLDLNPFSIYQKWELKSINYCKIYNQSLTSLFNSFKQIQFQNINKTNLLIDSDEDIFKYQENPLWKDYSQLISSIELLTQLISENQMNSNDFKDDTQWLNCLKINNLALFQICLKILYLNN